jgi:hypothetical protein
MTNEEFTEEVLFKSHSLGIRREVYELASQLKKKNNTLDFNASIQEAFYLLTK